MAPADRSSRGSARAYLLGGCLVLAAALLSVRVPQVPGLARGLLYLLAAALLMVALLRARDGEVSCDSSTPALRRRYLREFVPAIVGYVVAILVSAWLLKQVHDPVLRTLVALLPVPPIALVLRAIMRQIRDSDELQRRIELEAVSLATALVSLCYLAAGLLQAARVISVPASAALIWMFPLVCLTYGVVKLALMRRFR